MSLAGNLKHKENELLLDFMTVKNSLICSLIKNVIIKNNTNAACEFSKKFKP